MNKERIEALADFIEELPSENFSMNEFWENSSDFSCKSVGCIAGWACYLWQDEFVLHGDGGDPTSIEQCAMNILGLTNEEADQLFFPTGWPGSILERYGHRDLHDLHLDMEVTNRERLQELGFAAYKKATPKDAADVLRVFIEEDS